MMADSRIHQEIDLSVYSLLIKTGKAVFLSSAFVGCNLTGNNAYIEVITLRSDNVAIGNRLYLRGIRTRLSWFFQNNEFFFSSLRFAIYSEWECPHVSIYFRPLPFRYANP
jgi:hypothetical protein